MKGKTMEMGQSLDQKGGEVVPRSVEQRDP